MYMYIHKFICLSLPESEAHRLVQNSQTSTLFSSPLPRLRGTIGITMLTICFFVLLSAQVVEFLPIDIDNKLCCRPEDIRGPFGEFGPLKDIYLPRDYYTGWVIYVD